MRNVRMNRQMVQAAVLWTAMSFLPETAFANGKCLEVRGRFNDIYQGGSTSSGTITNAGVLNGTTLTVYNTAAFPTPEPTIVSYAADLTITTNQGQLTTRNVYLYDFATGRFTVMGRINPQTSTGRFAGVTGVLFINGHTVGSALPLSYPADISGEICVAK